MNPLTVVPIPVSRRRARGTTLIELMVALSVGMLLLTALAELFAHNSSARSEIDRTSQQVENGRYGIEVLREDIRQAGFFSGYDDALATSQATSACVPRSGVPLSPANLGWQASPALVPLSIHGFAGGDLPAADTCITRQKSNSDVLILRRLESESRTVALVATPAYADDLFMQTSRCSDPTIDPVGVPFVIAAGGRATPFVLHEKNCINAAAVRRLVIRAYYIGTCSDCTGAGDGVPTLRVVELSGGKTSNLPLVDGIETMRLEYAIDNDGNGTIDTLKRCKVGVDACTVADWRNVMAVQVRLISRNPGKSAGYVDDKSYDMGLAGTLSALNDGYKRHLYGSLVIAYNHTGPREQ
jgi:type IV pilus assembly protein PilW